MKRKLSRALARGALLALGLAALAVSLTGAASADTGRTTLRHGRVRPLTLVHDSITSSNWAGYAVTPTAGGTVSSLSNVVGTWVQPTVSCTSGTNSYSAFWVGLGGLTQDATSLEQMGTDANCTAAGTPVYSAWYEILPAAPVTLKLGVRPGDTVSAAVTVSGKTVSMRLRNLTLHTVVNRKLRMTAPDLSSAEWVAEAPSACNGSGRCTTLPLANFGSVDFLQAAATGSRHSGLISDPGWASTAISLDGSRDPAFGRFSNGAASASAAPSVLSAAGSFSVAWQAPLTPGT
jgi:Peptidase A4 family